MSATSNLRTRTEKPVQMDRLKHYKILQINIFKYFSTNLVSVPFNYLLPGNL